MSPTKGYYGLIQYCPDPARLECANIGVLLHCPEIGFIKSKIARGNDRIRRFFGQEHPNLDLDRINAAKNAIENRLRVEKEEFRSLEDLLGFINTRANELRVTQPRPIKVVEPEQTLQKLFDELVGGRPERGDQQPLFPDLERTFLELHQRLRDRVYLKRLVNVPKLGRLEVDYGFYNGSLNWVRTQRFQGENTRITELASMLAMQGRFIDKYSATEGRHERLIVISFISPDRVSVIEPKVKEIFGEVEQRLVTQEDVLSFIEEVRQGAH